jgi:GT2 family glycosyltransferase
VPTLDVVIVTWNSEASLPHCLASLAASARTRFTFDRIVIVDNASSAAIWPGQYDGLPAIALIANDRNRGFAAACNQGAEGSRADYVLFINPDAVVAPEALDRAVAAFDEPSRRHVAAIGLQLVDGRGAPQATCGRFLTFRAVFNQLTGLSLASPRRFRGFRMTDWDHRESREVDYVSAACTLLRRPVFAELGGFDEGFTVYLEDADFALRARRAGWRSLFLAGAIACHEGGWATGRDRAVRLAHAWRSLLVYSRKHFDPPRAVTLGLVTLTLAPLARLGEAVTHASGRELVNALAGYVRLYGLLASDLLRRARDRDGERAREIALDRARDRDLNRDPTPVRDSLRSGG